MSITIQVDLPETVASRAREAGLLDPARVADLITRELNSSEGRRNFFEIVRAIRAQPGEPMSPEEIAAEVDAVRAERRARETSR